MCSLLKTNISFCMVKKKLPEKAIKAAKDAIKYDPTNHKAMWRLGQAQCEAHDFEPAVASYKNAIQMCPQDRQLREDYARMIEYKNKKIKEWNSKMMGFFNKAETRAQMDQNDKEDELRKKIARQTFNDAWTGTEESKAPQAAAENWAAEETKACLVPEGGIFHSARGIVEDLKKTYRETMEAEQDEQLKSKL